MGKASLPPEVLEAHVQVPQPGSQQLRQARWRSASQGTEGSEQREANPVGGFFVVVVVFLFSGPISKYAKL